MKQSCFFEEGFSIPESASGMPENGDATVLVVAAARGSAFESFPLKA